MGIINIFVSTNSRPDQNGSQFQISKVSSSTSRLYITPISHLLKVLKFRLFSRWSEPSRKAILKFSKKANVRCLDCGWKYDFTKISHCPICSSEKAYLLINGGFFSGFVVVSVMLTIFSLVMIFVYKTLVG